MTPTPRYHSADPIASIGSEPKSRYVPVNVIYAARVWPLNSFSQCDTKKIKLHTREPTSARLTFDILKGRQRNGRILHPWSSALGRIRVDAERPVLIFENFPQHCVPARGSVFEGESMQAQRRVSRNTVVRNDVAVIVSFTRKESSLPTCSMPSADRADPRTRGEMNASDGPRGCMANGKWRSPEHNKLRLW